MPRTRTIAWAAGSLLLLAAVVVLLLPRVLDERRVRSEAERRLSAALGRPVTIGGPLRIEGGSSLSIDARDVRIGGGTPEAPPLLVVERVRASIEAASLVGGPLEIGAVVLDRPRVALHVDRNGRGTWEGLGGASDPSRPARAWRVAALTIADGELRYTDARSGTDVTLQPWQLKTGRVALPEPVELTTSFVARRGDAPLGRADVRAAVSADANSQKYAVDALTIDAALARANGDVPVRLATERVEYSGAEAAATLRGLTLRALGIELHADGTARQLAASPSAQLRWRTAPFEPRAVLTSLGVALPPMTAPDALQRAQAAGRLEYGEGRARLVDLDATLDSTRLTGTASVSAAPPRAWSFDLAADRLDADRYLKPPKLRDRSPVELPLDALRALNASGTLRVGELKAKGVRLRDVVLDLGPPAPEKRP